MTGRKFETEAEDFKQQARRGAREFLGVAQTDVSKRPLLASRGVWGLTVSAQYVLLYLEVTLPYSMLAYWRRTNHHLSLNWNFKNIGNPTLGN